MEKPRATDGAAPPELLHHEDRARFTHLPRRVPFLIGANGNRGRRHRLRGESRPGDRSGHQLPGNGRSPRDAGKSRRRSHRHPHPGNDSFSLAKSLAKSLADAIANALTPAIRHGIAARIPYMPAKSKKQQMAAGAALSAKRGEASKSSLKGASRQMEKSMSEKQLEEIAHTKRKSLPKKKG